MPEQARFKAAFPYRRDIVALPVVDIDAAARWYAESFGMVEVERRDLPAPTVILERDGTRIGSSVNGGDASQDGAAILVSGTAVRQFVRHTSIILVSASLLTACVSNRPPLRTIDRAEARWQSASITNYGFKLHGSAFILTAAECSGPDGAVEVEVRSERTVKFGTCDTSSKFAQAFGSVPAIFSTIREEWAAQPPELKVRFDDTNGHPEFIWINYERWMTDHSVSYSVHEFRELQ